MNNSSETVNEDEFDFVWEMHHMAAYFIIEDDMDGVENFLVEIACSQRRFIVFIIYLLKNCRHHQASKISYFVAEFSTHTYHVTNHVLFIEEFFMWRRLNSEQGIYNLLDRIERARELGRISPDFEISRYL